MEVSRLLKGGKRGSEPAGHGTPGVAEGDKEDKERIERKNGREEVIVQGALNVLIPAKIDGKTAESSRGP